MIYYDFRIVQNGMNISIIHSWHHSLLFPSPKSFYHFSWVLRRDCMNTIHQLHYRVYSMVQDITNNMNTCIWSSSYYYNLDFSQFKHRILDKALCLLSSTTRFHHRSFLYQPTFVQVYNYMEHDPLYRSRNRIHDRIYISLNFQV